MSAGDAAARSYRAEHPVRFVTASSLFDGHDASINIMRRILQAQGAEVIHLGHNRSVREVVDAALEEDVQGVAVSSYQGGHVEYFEYLVESLRDRGAGHVRVFGGGGGVIVPQEIERLSRAGVRIFSPEEGQRLGLVGMIQTMIEACDTAPWEEAPAETGRVQAGERPALARLLSGAAAGTLPLQGGFPGRLGPLDPGPQMSFTRTCRWPWSRR
ncbi:cobalamin-dependent protein, partial [Streptomyces sp. NPDC005143]